MLSEKILVKINHKFYYGWVIVFVAALSQFFSGPGQTFSVSIFINSYIEDFEWSRSTVSSFYSFATLTSGLILFNIGRLVDKKGHKAIIPLVGIILSLACFFSGIITNYVMLFLSFFMLRFFGQGSLTLLPSTLVPKWFIKRRGIALSITSIGLVVSSAMLPLINNYLISMYSWRFTWWFWGFIVLLVFVPLSRILTVNKPQDIDLESDDKYIQSKETKRVNKTHDENKSEEEDLSKDKYTQNSWTVKEAFRTRAFWFMLFAQGIPPMVLTGVTFHFVSIIGQKGFEDSFAAILLSVIAIVSFAFTFLAGYILDKVKVHLIIAVIFLVHIISLLILLYGQSYMALVLFAGLTGVTIGFRDVSSNVLWANYYGQKNLGSIRGLTMTSVVVGSAFGPLPFGFAFDNHGSYTEIILVMILFHVLGFFASILSPPPKKEC